MNDRPQWVSFFDDYKIGDLVIWRQTQRIGRGKFHTHELGTIVEKPSDPLFVNVLIGGTVKTFYDSNSTIHSTLSIIKDEDEF